MLELRSGLGRMPRSFPLVGWCLPAAGKQVEQGPQTLHLRPHILQLTLTDCEEHQLTDCS